MSSLIWLPGVLQRCRRFGLTLFWICWLLQTCFNHVVIGFEVPHVEVAKFLQQSTHWSHTIQDFEVTLPFQVDHYGQYVSHDLSPQQRNRRSTSSATSSLYYNITAFGEQFHVQLQPNYKLFAPSFQIYRKKHRRKEMQRVPASPMVECIYTGTILSHHSTESHAAVSVCNGMMGILRTSKAEYIVQPLPSHLHRHFVNTSHASASHYPHVIYMKSSLHSLNSSSSHGTNHLCHSNNNSDHLKALDNKLQPFQQPKDKKDNDGDKENHLIHKNQRYKRSTALYSHHRHRHHQHQRRVKDGKNKEKLRNLETLVVIDKNMLDAHGDKNVTTYTLTVLNMVSKLFHDNSIGEKINIVLTALVLLEGDEAGLRIGKNAEKTLDSFCQWQSALKHRENFHHDHAILLTATDLCVNEYGPCDTLGFAPIQGMCSSRRSCTINEDTGLGVAFTIAHEVGHNLGMVHDGEGNYCSKYDGGIMSPTLSVGNDGVFKWSVCSREYLQKFLQSHQSRCLSEDEPKMAADYSFPDKLPGQMYDADTQCKWQFGSSASLCNFDFGREMCKYLWCHTVGYKCETKFLPAADGTRCAPGKWCLKGLCLPEGDSGPESVDGQWSDWSAWTLCSRTCGRGVQLRKRDCNNPKPKFGGEQCPGNDTMYQLCNTERCPTIGSTYRALQCTSRNYIKFRGWYYKWEPYTKVPEEDQCKLYCKAKRYSFYYQMSTMAGDGTQCLYNPQGVCVQGVCRIPGCDGILDSGAVEDSCGICGGKNNTCDKVTGTFTTPARPHTYHFVTKIPKGSMEIEIHMLQISASFLAVRNLRGKYYLNGDWQIQWSRNYQFGGTTFSYSRSFKDPERLEAKGPITEDLVIMVMIRGPNPGVKWQYRSPLASRLPEVHNNNIQTSTGYSWRVETAPCSRTCAGGEQVVSAVCVRDGQTTVSEDLCEQSSKPVVGLKPCNQQPCPARWETEPWGDCSASCGGGHQKRRVMCMQMRSRSNDVRVKGHHCQGVRPHRRQQCNVHHCPPMWQTGSWSECSTTCGEGVRTRTIECRSLSPRGDTKWPDTLCQFQKRPNSTTTCYQQACLRPRWSVGKWTLCSVKCGRGQQRRYLRCFIENNMVDDKRCASVPRPVVSLMKECDAGKQCSVKGKWYASPWSQCSVSCGEGEQTRFVKCLGENGEKENEVTINCEQSFKPTTSQTCNLQACPTPKPCEDEYKWCYLVPLHHYCSKKYYSATCCKSCRGT
ncbi:A disintegrin and metalloproteinase with thrombospondin motifs 18 isoform X1 [Lingula anatina]|uniref:A disintegrin and metalloproteinase with thrombospondin motifs 18 isoform X1 n=1 Tax=Lingula anatina TaxID=7574 RepID=A0A1S3HSN9_LINAN|nr:A disintegrin and metalloproteinase with thrombospondin motifs 18 isoform X1 [Lingula anatina]|eukprot:XP_013389055.1 A disintegrin and metalloproteinase with thrombospondin motifs 18 isoform X1 [Lingula anatina]